MAEKAFENVSAGDIVVAMNEIERMDRTYRAVQGAKAVLSVLAGRNQIVAEIDRKIADKRVELASLEAVTVEQFKTQGEAEVKRIVAEAEAKAKTLIADARRIADEVGVMAASKRAELAAVNGRLEVAAKQAAAYAASLAG